MNIENEIDLEHINIKVQCPCCKKVWITGDDNLETKCPNCGEIVKIKIVN